jgi:hypothetical protein
MTFEGLIEAAKEFKIKQQKKRDAENLKTVEILREHPEKKITFIVYQGVDIDVNHVKYTFYIVSREEIKAYTTEKGTFETEGVPFHGFLLYEITVFFYMKSVIFADGSQEQIQQVVFS